MGRYYTGDIEGKFWFGVQSSDDASFFGGSEEVNEEEGEIEYFFQKGDLDDIEFGLEECKKNLGVHLMKMDEFFDERDSYSDEDLAKDLGVPESKTRVLLEWYARLELGNKIRKCVVEQGQCAFTGEL